MKLLERNMKLILEQSPEMVAAIQSSSLLEGRIVYEGERSHVQLQLGERCLFLHSLYNREREFKEMFRDVPERVTRLIIFGLGDGEILKYIKKKYLRLEHLVIIEPHGTVVERFLKYNKLEEAFDCFKKVSFLVNYSQETLVYELNNILNTAATLESYNSVVGLFAYQIAYGEYYRSIIQGALRALRFYRVNKATKETYRSLWLVNFWRNLRHAEVDLDMFKSVFAGRPAIVVSAGPSLNKNVALLEHLRDKALIIAVGSAMTILEKRGITPHFRIAVDAVKENELLFQTIDTKKCPLIYSDQVYYETVDNYQGPKVHMTLSGITKTSYLFEKAKWRFMEVRSGFSVANVAFDMLLKFKCSTVILMGQDLCYTEGRMHAHGSWDAEFDEKQVHNEVETVNIFGEKVYTDRPFLGMKMLFENLSKAYSSDVKLINATEGGLEIEGMLHKPLAEVEEQDLTAIYDFAGEISKALEMGKENLAIKQVALKEAVDGMHRAIAELIELNDRNRTDIDKTLRLVMGSGDNKKIAKGVEKITKTFRVINSKELYQKVISGEFEAQFKLRHFASEKEGLESRQTLQKDLGVFLENTLELQAYLCMMKDLIEEYRGEKTLDIIIE